ncbi:hypothetical protein OG427_07230 [Streptomyces sp. NBC_00133]|uniref:hypothetical protein n=1 Tax=Streptomyces sp. NBC_00133 TaxID=2903624 RepID=UPI00324A4A7F
MPLSDQHAWDAHIEYRAICSSRDRDALTLLRCAVHTLLEHGCFMAADDIPLAEILTGGGDYLRRLAASPGGDHATPVSGPEHWARVDAEVRLAWPAPPGFIRSAPWTPASTK